MRMRKTKEVRCRMTFVQFYSTYKTTSGDKGLSLNNGFSSVWNFIKNEGDMIWININKGGCFPEVTSPVYISCCWRDEFEYIRKWCYTRPDLSFIVGGPGIINGDFKATFPNLKIDKRQMYEVLGCGQKFELWNLEPPKELLTKDTMVRYHYSFSSITKCYWGRCTFCNEGKMYGPALDMEDVPIINPGNNHVWVNKMALHPNDMIRLFPKFGSESIYNFYMRGDKKVLNILNDVPIISNIYPAIGVEFPSDRMFRYMNKGTTVDTLVDVMIKFLEKGCIVFIMLIDGWPNLVQSDVDSVKYFLSRLEPFKKQIHSSAQTLYSLDENRISADEVRPFLIYRRMTYVYKLDKEQEKLKNEISQLYKQFGFLSYNDFAIKRVEELIKEYKTLETWRKLKTKGTN